jgi:hypothetical protein
MASSDASPLAKLSQYDMVRIVQSGKVNAGHVFGSMASISDSLGVTDGVKGGLTDSLGMGGIGGMGGVGGGGGDKKKKKKKKKRALRQYMILSPDKTTILYHIVEHKKKKGEKKKKKKSVKKMQFVVVEGTKNKLVSEVKDPLIRIKIDEIGAHIKDHKNLKLGSIIKPRGGSGFTKDILFVRDAKQENKYQLLAKTFAMQKNPGSKHFFIRKTGDYSLLNLRLKSD